MKEEEPIVQQSPTLKGSGPSSAYTQPIQEVVGHRSEVREGMVWQWGEGKIYYGVPLQALLGEMSCCNDIPLKRSKYELDPLSACYKG